MVHPEDHVVSILKLLEAFLMKAALSKAYCVQALC